MCQDICFLVKFGSDLAEHARASSLEKKLFTIYPLEL
jgi:hypothetical protein